MKNFTNNFKQFTSRLSARWLIMALMILVGSSSAWADNITGGITFYLKPNNVFDKEGNPWFAIYLCNGTAESKWIKMTQVTGESGLYEATVPDTGDKYHTNVIFCRMNPSCTELKWDCRWNQTADLTYSNNKNLFTVTGWSNSQGTGNWSQKTLYYLMGLTDWVHGDNLSSSVSKNLAVGTHNFKVRDSQGNWYGNNGTMTRNGTSVQSGGWTMSTNEGNCGITADVAGDYNFTFDANTKKLTVTYPELPCYTPSDVDPGTISSNATNNTICGSGSVELTLSNTTSKNDLTRTIQWQKYNGSAWSNISNATATTYTEIISATTKYRAKVKWEKSGCDDLIEYSSVDGFTITVNALPSAPSFEPISAQCGSYTLPTEDKNEVNVNWYTAATDGEKITSVNTTSTYHAEAVDGTCISASRTPVQITINTKPSIGSIAQSVQSPVPFEDVVLTANDVTSGAEVNWYVGENLVAENTNTYTVTSDEAGEVIVKAKAFLGDCESEATTKTVKFDAEDCTPEVSNDIKITFKTPSNNSNDGQYWGIGSLYYKKDNGASYTEVKLYENDNCQGGEQTSQEVTISNLQNNATVYFKACYDYGGYTATTKKLTLTKGKKYIIGIISNQNPSSKNDTNKTSEVGIEVTSEVSLTQDPEIKAPAVKMVSAEYDEENDVIVATGAVYKTGCGVTFWGFQYSEDGQAWGTEDTDYIRPISGNSLTVPGEFDYSFPIPGANGGETYYIRAYALNNYNGSYALSNAVYSATSLPVEIPSKTINSATISLVDSEGKPSDVTEVCPQSIVYLKVSYDGGDFTDFVAEENFPGTDLKLVNHDKTNNYAIFSFTATAAGTANITISNNSGSTVTPAVGVSITLKDVQVVTTPIIYLEKNTICENQNTNVVVNSPIVGFIYSLKNGSVGDPITYESGDLKFEVNKEGSYTVQVQETVCRTTAISAPVDLRVIASDVKITLTTDVNTINPWQPLTLTVKAPSGYDYDLQGLDGTVYTKSGDVYTIKFPRPDSWGVGNSASISEPKTFIAGIKAGEEPSCSTTTKEIQLVDTEEVCLAPGN